MNSSWRVGIKNILEQEPEVWLAYLQGQKIEEVPALRKNKPRITGTAAQFLAAVLQVVKKTRWKSSYKASKIFFYAGSINQKTALSGSFDYIKNNGEDVCGFTDSPALSDPDYKLLSFSALDFARWIFLLIVRLPSLLKDTRDGPPNLRSWYFGTFCRASAYLCLFYRVLSHADAEIVVVSNDHNLQNRCLVAVAHMFKIKTVYLQHASVTSVFPALRFDFALLDGRAALDTYLDCEKNQPSWVRKAPEPKVFFVGQQKKLNVRNKSVNRVGLAVNVLDEEKDVVSVARDLVSEKIPLTIRWHPRQSKNAIEYLKGELFDEDVIWSDPRQEGVDAFFSRADYVVAGNSSILLEAALVGLSPIYFPLTKSAIHDYYGYVRNGLAICAQSNQELVAMLRSRAQSNELKKISAIRYYSHTYETAWFGREAELAGKIISNLPCPTIYSDAHGYVGEWSEISAP